jgi:hypothetical protein
MSFERQAGSARATDDGAVDLEQEIDAAAGPSYLPRLLFMLWRAGQLNPKLSIIPCTNG